MARGIRVPFIADVSDWLRGVAKMAGSLDDTERDLDKIGRDAKRAGDDVEESFERAGRQAEDAFRDMARDADRQFERIESDAERTGRQIDEALTKQTRKGKLGEIGSELGEELAENVGEGFRSGNAGDVIFESLTSLAPALGGVGLVIGGVAGLVGGIIRGAEEATAETQAKIGELASTWFDTAQEAYNSGKDAAEALAQGFIAGSRPYEDLAGVLGVDSVQEAWAEVARLAELTTLPVETITSATLGNRDALLLVEQQLDTNNGLVDEMQREQDTVAANDQERYRELQGQIESLNEQNDALADITGYQEESAQAMEDASRAGKAYAEYLQGTIGPQATIARDAERANSGLSGAQYNAYLLRERLERISTPSFDLVQSQLGYAAANAWSLANALGTVNDEADLKGIARGALLQ